jgi:hypothetical protein
MNNPPIEPTLTLERKGQCEPHEVYDHPAFGTIVMTHPTGGHQDLFGSDVGSMGCVRIAIHKATLHRDLSRDWVFPDMAPLVAIEMTHAQFAMFITGAGRGEGTPVTLIRASDTPAKQVPPIKRIENKQDVFKREIKRAAEERLESMSRDVDRLQALIDSGKLSIKAVREVVRSLQINLQNAPSNLAFVVESAEEALEEATSNAKIEVEAFIDARARSLGLSNIRQLGTLPTEDSAVVGELSQSSASKETGT